MMDCLLVVRSDQPTLGMVHGSRVPGPRTMPTRRPSVCQEWSRVVDVHGPVITRGPFPLPAMLSTVTPLLGGIPRATPRSLSSVTNAPVRPRRTC